MQNQAALAYQQVAKQTASPRDREANLLSRSAATLQRVRDNWDGSRAELGGALQFNRKLWTVFMTSVAKEDNPLPAPLRQNVANIGVFVMGQTVRVLARPEPHKLDTLININRQLAAGLRDAPQSE